ncbi:hypothetical protein TraAM80_01269 [Trypanosoma rangeli]|uniref:Uncharacterized protein n=1 Tax=Trypanosoma rangeli TaxID=5698 RepID=A0A422NZM9_TRYRA|nr:uncharacterized protein TraAM80_01269 [Trypanosoma rangeli]RNF10885.1 hypothetical protein TraAM80_01269 [Trypanosoma rangeli]|eukprot:RNF10885.1 hypothetical protein TraAM80_01269 [Trypanosoma rangeli]
MLLQRNSSEKMQATHIERRGLFTLAGNVDKKAGQHILLQQSVFLLSAGRGGLRRVLSQVHQNSALGSSYVISGFLTRLYNASSVEKSAGRMDPQQLLAYYNQTGTCRGARVRFFDGVVDLDRKALHQVVQSNYVDELLLLVFNDWDHNADKYIAVVYSLARLLQTTKSSSVPNSFPQDVHILLNSTNISVSQFVSPRPGAFAGALNLDEARWEGEDGPSRIFFTWPQEASSGKPVQVIAAMRRADVNSNNIFGTNTLSLILQSPGIFFCSKQMTHVAAYEGPPDVKELAKFVAANTISHFQLNSVEALRSVLRQFDTLALIVYRGEGGSAPSAASPLRDILFNNTLDTRFRLKAAMPTFLLQEEQLAGSDNVKWDELRVVVLQRLERKSLQFMATLFKDELPVDFVEQLNLLPASSEARLIVLDRAQLTPEGGRGASIADFSASVLYFPAPSERTDHHMWSSTIGARLVDFVESDDVHQSSPVPVTGKNLQKVYERHFRVLLQDQAADMRQRPFAEDAVIGSVPPRPKGHEPRLLVVVVLPPANARGSNACERAAFHAAHASPRDEGIRFATAAVDVSSDLVEELRFTVWRHPERKAATMCEIYIFHPDGKVDALDLDPRELHWPKDGWLNLFLRGSPKEHRGALSISHPLPDEYFLALIEFSKKMRAVKTPDPHSEFRTSLYGTADGFAPWFLWLPPLEAVPLLVHVQKNNPAEGVMSPQSKDTTARAAEVTLLLLHDSSCGMTVNHLKAFRLLAKCQESHTPFVGLVLLEYDLASGFLMPGGSGWRPGLSGKNGDQAEHAEVYSRLKPFLQDFKRLHPPQLFAINRTHVISTIDTSLYYGSSSGVGWMELHNGYIRNLLRLASHADRRLVTDALSTCVRQTLLLEAQRRVQYRAATQHIS